MGKERWDLLPWSGLRAVVQVLTFYSTAEETAASSAWRNIEGWRARHFASLMRHLWAWMRGERRDSESGLPHLAHAAARVLFLLELSESMRACEGPALEGLPDEAETVRWRPHRAHYVARAAESEVMRCQCPDCLGRYPERDSGFKPFAPEFVKRVGVAGLPVLDPPPTPFKEIE